MGSLVTLMVVLAAAGCQQADNGPQSWREKLAGAPRRSLASLTLDADAWRVPLKAEPLEQAGGSFGPGNATIQPEDRWGNMLHRVRAGDNLYKLARSYYGDAKYWRLILAENGDVVRGGGVLQVGQLLHLPTGPLGRDEMRRPPGKRPDHYVITGGDTLAGIARWLLKDERLWRDVFDSNRGVLRDADRLAPGTVLRIPGKP